MKLSPKTRTLILRFARSFAATVVGALAVIFASPEFVEWLDDPTMQVLVLTFAVPLIITLEKYLRYGQDPGEED